MNICIRRAQRADSDELTKIAHAAKRYWNYPKELLDLWTTDLTVTPGFIARHPVYCALRGQTVVGFYAVSGTHDARELEHMWVHPRHIGTGVGRTLFAHLLQRLHAMGVTRLKVASDPNAEGFYRRMGARRLGSISSKPSGRTLPLLVVRVPVRKCLTSRCRRRGPRRRSDNGRRRIAARAAAPRR